MQPFYEYRGDRFEIFATKGKHSPPHLHKSLECIYVLKGVIELGVRQEFFHMEEGDFAIIFPEIIHHYQVFDPKGCELIYLFANPEIGGKFESVLQQSRPVNPVIHAKNLHPDIRYAMKSLLKSQEKKCDNMIYYGFMQIILARAMVYLELIEKETIGGEDIIYQLVSYLASHYREKVTLPDMAQDLGYSQYTLSRVFSKIFHSNFNQYLNNLRVDYAAGLLAFTNQSITEVWLNAGFESQRTFQRVFKSTYNITPREFRKKKGGAL